MLLLGAIIMAAPSVLDAGFGSGMDPTGNTRRPVADVPADDPEAGLVYQGLAPAAKGAPCAGAYEVVSRDICSHGPDKVPPGLDVSRDVKPVARAAAQPAAPARDESGAVPDDVAVARDEGAVTPGGSMPALVAEAAPGGAPFAVGDAGIACDGDGRSGKRIQVLYLYEFGNPSRYREYLASFRTWAAGVDAIFDASAAETGGSRRLRYVTTPDCKVDVAEVQVPAGALASFEANITALRELGYNRTDRKYLIFADTKVYCGIGTFIGDRRPGRGNRNNGGPSYGRTDAGCWSAAVAAHELAHNLGAVLSSAPNASKAGHCVDDYDLMCHRDDRATPLRVVCGDRGHELRLDCNHDDYFHTDPSPGSYLAKNWNVADNQFLLRGKNRDTAPPPADTAAADTEPADIGPPAGASTDASTDDSGAAPSGEAGAPDGAPAGPSPDRADPPTPSSAGATPTSPPPPQRAVLESGETTSTSTRLVWPAAAPGTRYVVVVDGRAVATTEATRARLIGLRPDTEYRLQIVLPGAVGPHTAPVTLRTAPAAQPAADTWFLLGNSLTGGAADLYGARTANGTPIVHNRAEGGAQQLWKLTPAGDGSFQLVSKVTGKCVVPLRNHPVVGTPLVQGTCSKDDTTQHWWIGRTAYGFTLRTALGDLVVGLGRQRFGGPRLLVLQTPEQGARHQSWTSLPG